MIEIRSQSWENEGMELYHVLNRGVEKRNLFLDNADRARFVHDLFEFNDSKPAGNSRRLSSMIEIRSQSLVEDRDRIVDIHGWCLMDNHYHLLLSEIAENGLTRFIRKLNVGYAMYFNEKYRRAGTLFQGRTKRIRISSEAHFLHILHYIHLNPLDFHRGSRLWRDGMIDDARGAAQHLRGHRWSSYLDYCNHRNFPSILTTALFGDVFKDYKKALATYLKEITIGPIRPFLLE